MHRPSRIWLVFALSAIVLLAVMSWVSLTTYRLDRLQAAAAQAADLEERARLALWRMDSWLAPFLSEENARPASAYDQPPSGRTRVPADPGATASPRTPLPSPRFLPASSHILLYFQLEPDGRLTSPQVPPEAARPAARATPLDAADIDASAARLASLGALLDRPASAPAPAGTIAIAPATPSPPGLAASGTGGLDAFSNAPPSTPPRANRELLIRHAGTASDGTPGPLVPPPSPLATTAPTGPTAVPLADLQQFRNTAEWNFRANTFQQAQMSIALNNLAQTSAFGVGSDDRLHGGVFNALWLEDALILARRVARRDGFAVQGCWLHWTNLQTALLTSVQDLLPAAALEPVRQPAEALGAHRLATLPVRLRPGPVPPPNARGGSALRVWLVTAWACVLVAGVAVGLLLQGTLSLSERRAAFVSAVTHELRTPLTTFQMYAEMLATGMVSEEAKRTYYLKTLVSEAGRLSHLVENVLAYARLERGSARRRVQPLSLGTLLEQVRPRLLERAAQAGLSLVEDAHPSAQAACVQVDAAAVEQILFNLVDNACKYAAPTATQKTLHLEARPGNRRCAVLRVRDHGPGLSPAARRRLFEPFGKSADAAAQTAPGVGLGLALSRRLIRSLGGDLRHDDAPRDGACFILSLPRAHARFPSANEAAPSA